MDYEKFNQIMSLMTSEIKREGLFNSKGIVSARSTLAGAMLKMKKIGYLKNEHDPFIREIDACLEHIIYMMGRSLHESHVIKTVSIISDIVNTIESVKLYKEHD